MKDGEYKIRHALGFQSVGYRNEYENHFFSQGEFGSYRGGS